MARGEGDTTRELMVVPSQDVTVTPTEPVDSELVPSRFAQRLRAGSPQETEATYVAARDAWTAAMRAASSGRAADLASLALAQEAYEAAAAERERWFKSAPSARTAIPVDAPGGGSGEIDMVVRQELDWKRVKEAPPPPRGFKGLVRRILGD